MLAHNIRSLWNVGSFFRTADAFKVEKIILTGYTGTPPRREISKTALKAEEWIPWKYNKNPIDEIKILKKDGYRIIALEITKEGIDLAAYKAPEKCCLIVGNEVLGVPKEILDIADDHVFIPMRGKKESLNVGVAAGIASYHLTK